jgi:hypothetical protein
MRRVCSLYASTCLTCRLEIRVWNILVNTIFTEIIYVYIWYFRIEVGNMTNVLEHERDIMNLQALPTEEVTCEECTHTVKATTWSIATRVGSVSFFRCPFCGHTWHKYRR